MDSCMENPIEEPGGYSPWGCKESDMTKWLTHTHTHTQNIPGMSFPQLAGQVLASPFLIKKIKLPLDNFHYWFPFCLWQKQKQVNLYSYVIVLQIFEDMSLFILFLSSVFFKPKQIQIFPHFLMWSDSLTFHHLKEWPLSRFCVLTKILALS